MMAPLDHAKPQATQHTNRGKLIRHPLRLHLPQIIHGKNDRRRRTRHRVLVSHKTRRHPTKTTSLTLRLRPTRLQLRPTRLRLRPTRLRLQCDQIIRRSGIGGVGAIGGQLDQRLIARLRRVLSIFRETSGNRRRIGQRGAVLRVLVEKLRHIHQRHGDRRGHLQRRRRAQLRQILLGPRHGIVQVRVVICWGQVLETRRLVGGEVFRGDQLQLCGETGAFRLPERAQKLLQLRVAHVVDGAPWRGVESNRGSGGRRGRNGHRDTVDGGAASWLRWGGRCRKWLLLWNIGQVVLVFFPFHTGIRKGWARVDFRRGEERFVEFFTRFRVDVIRNLGLC